MSSASRVSFSLQLLATAASVVAFASRAHASAPGVEHTVHTTLAARVGYDDNVFLQDKNPLLPGVVGAVPAEAGSWVARGSVAFEAAGRSSPAFQFDVAYTPEIVRYEDQPSENHDNHALNLGLRGHEGPWSYQLKGGALFVDGSEDSPIYGQVGGGPAVGGAGVRARREQLTSKLSAQLTRAWTGGWVRAVGDGVAHDYRARTVDPALTPGYANYVDRAEGSAGFDFGKNVSQDFALVAGVRTGEQHQENLLGVPHNYSNAFTRYLLGVEGKPRNDLTLRLLAGPDVRHFGDEVAAGYDRTRTGRYVEASATWTPRVADTVTFTAKDYLWLSSGGRCAFQHTTARLHWKHAFNPDWNASLGAAIEIGDSTDYAPAPPGRDDTITTGTFTVTRLLGAHTQLDFQLLREWSDSAIADTPGREYTRWFASVGLRRVF